MKYRQFLKYYDCYSNNLPYPVDIDIDFTSFITDLNNIKDKKYWIIRNKYFISPKTFINILAYLNLEYGKPCINQYTISEEIYQKLNSKEWLELEYSKKLTGEIAKDLGVGAELVSKYLKKHRIIIRNSREHNYYINRNTENLKKITKEVLEDLYNNKRYSAAKIGSMFNTSDVSILSQMKEFGIKVHKDGDWQYVGREETKKKLEDKEFLINEHYKNNKSCVEIGNDLEISQATILRWMKIHNIERRSNLEYKGITSSLHNHRLIPLFEKNKIKHKTSFILRTDKGVYEIDEYLPDKKMFIELQGVYWHDYLKTKSKTKSNTDEIKRESIKNNYPDHKLTYLLDFDFRDELGEYLINMIIEGKEIPLRLPGYNHDKFIEEIGFKHKKYPKYVKRLKQSIL